MAKAGQCKICDRIIGVSLCGECRYVLRCIHVVNEWNKLHTSQATPPDIEHRIRVYRERADAGLPLFEDKEKDHGIMA